MALRLRRGTDAERITIIPLEGELIYTTDTEKVYVGDGTTAGGNLISTFAISDLNDVNTSGISVGDVLKWNGATFVPGPDADGGGVVDGNTYNINVNGDVRGSVFGDDSSVIVDSVNNIVNAPKLRARDVTAIGNDFKILNADDLSDTFFTVNANTTNTGVVSLKRNSTTDLSADTVAHGRIVFSREDTTNGLETTASITGRNDALFLFQDSTANPADVSRYVAIKDGALGIGTITPTATLDVQGAIKPGVYADATARDAAVASPVEGMMVFLQDTQKFVGYVSDTGLAGGGASNSTAGWVDLN